MKRRSEPEAMAAEKNEMLRRVKRLCSKNQLEDQTTKQKQNEKPVENEQTFEEKLNEIKGLFKFNKRNYLFVDVLSNETKPEFIDTALSEFDKDVDIRHHWKMHKCDPSGWVGAVAVFKTPEKAMEVRSQLKDSMYITVVSMQEVLDILIKAEIHYPKSKETPTVVYVSGKKSFPPSKENLIWPIFERFGKVTNIKLITVPTSGLIARVSYKYASHALVAKFFIDQGKLMVAGIVSAEVIMTRKERSLLDYMRHYIRDKFTYKS